MVAVVMDPLADEVADGQHADPLVDPDPVEVGGIERSDEIDAVGPEREELGQQLGRVAQVVAASGGDRDLVPALEGRPVSRPGSSGSGR